MPPEERREIRNSPFPPPGDLGSWFWEITIASIVFVIVLLLIGYYLEWGLDSYRAFLDAVYRIWERIRTIVMVLTLIASAGLVGFMVITFQKFKVLQKHLPDMAPTGKKIKAATMKPERAKKEIGNEWQEVQKLIQSENTSDWNMAVLRADTLLDDVLQYLGYEGATVKERLDTVDPFSVPSLDRLWSAHRLRNAIAHDPSVAHTRETIDYALRAYETAFREMGVMEEVFR